MRRRSLALTVVATVAVLGACTGGDDRSDAVPAMVLETCAPGGDPAAEPVCRCAYEALLERFGAAELERLDLQLQTDPDALPEEARRLVLDCAFERIDPTPPTVPTSATTGTTSADASTTSTDATTTSTSASTTSTDATTTSG